MGTEYILSWQVTAAVFVIIMVIMWFMSGLFKFPRIVGILIAVGLAFAARFYWWMVDARVTEWMRFMGLEV